MLLQLPDIRQDSDYDCGAACLACLFTYYQIDTPTWVRPLCDPKHGLSPDAMYSALRGTLGEHAVILGSRMTVGILRGLCNDGKPVLCPIICPDGEGHWVIVRGVGEKAVYYHDPLVGPRRLSLGAWNQIWDTGKNHHWRAWGVTAWL